MGASSSKQSASSAPHVWKGPSSPTSVSQGMAESFQSSTETDHSRHQLTELQVQARVSAELKKLHAQEESRLRDMTAQIAAATSPDDTPTSRHAVSGEVAALRERLEARSAGGVRDVPDALERARGDVVRCLTENDRRPLDCWREVERFKEEVRRLERGWVEKVIS